MPRQLTTENAAEAAAKFNTAHPVGSTVRVRWPVRRRVSSRTRHYTTIDHYEIYRGKVLEPARPNSIRVDSDVWVRLDIGPTNIKDVQEGE